MTIDEIILFLDSGLTILFIDIVFQRLDLKIPLKDYRQRTWRSLPLGIVFVGLSSGLYLIVQNLILQLLPGITPTGLFIIALVLCLFAIFGKGSKKKG